VWAAAPSGAHTPGLFYAAATGGGLRGGGRMARAHPRAGAMAELEVGVPAEALAPAPWIEFFWTILLRLGSRRRRRRELHAAIADGQFPLFRGARLRDFGRNGAFAGSAWARRRFLWSRFYPASAGEGCWGCGWGWGFGLGWGNCEPRFGIWPSYGYSPWGATMTRTSTRCLLEVLGLA